jgi:hypothetical protein
MSYSAAFQELLDDPLHRDPGLEPRAGDVVQREGRGRVIGRTVLRTFFSPFARQRFVVYRVPSGRTFSMALDRWRNWAGAA